MQKKTYIIIVFFFFLLLFINATTYDEPLPYTPLYPSYFRTMPTNPNNPMTKEGVELGKKLFFDKMLSGSNEMACANCHQQNLAFTDGLKTAKGSKGKNVLRNTMSLVNLAWSSHYFWDGRVAELEQLIPIPILNKDEMAQDTTMLLIELQNNNTYKQAFYKVFESKKITMQQVSYALSQYLKTLISYQSPMDTVFMNFRENQSVMAPELCQTNDPNNLLAAGLKSYYGKKYEFTENVLTMFGTCIKCHDKEFFGFEYVAKNNGLPVYDKDIGIAEITHKAQDKGRFKVPTLRNIALTAPYMHDGRFATLQEVITYYNAKIPNTLYLSDELRTAKGKPKQFKLSEKEIQQMIELLNMFTDKKFINNTK